VQTARSTSPGGTATAEVGSATVTAQGAGAFTVADFEEDPSTGSPFRTSGGYFDVRVATGSTFRSINVTTCGLTADDAVFWWDGTQWARATDQTFADGCITVTITEATSPGLDDLGGTPFAVGTVQAARIAGTDRIATAIAMSSALYADSESASSAVIASSDLTDALAGGPLATAVDGPLLLTSPAGLNADVLAELARAVAPGARVYLLGGTAALPASFDDSIRAAGFDPVRVAGPDRYATAVAVAERIGDPTVVYLADGGLNAAASGAAAAARGGAVLLASPAADAYLAAHDVEVEHAVGLAAAATIDEPAEIIAVSSTADALVAATLAGARRAALILVPATGSLRRGVASFAANADTVAALTIVGGTGAVTANIGTQLEDALRR
jgi:hypothetical protein